MRGIVGGTGGIGYDLVFWFQDLVVHTQYDRFDAVICGWNR